MTGTPTRTLTSLVLAFSQRRGAFFGPQKTADNGLEVSRIRSFRSTFLSFESGIEIPLSERNMWSARLPDKIYARMGAFSLVGVANTIAGVTVIVIAGLLGANAILANIFGYGTGLIVSFVFNSRFTFQGRVINHVTVLRFLGAWAIAFSVNICAVYFTTTILGYHGLFASLAGAPLFTSIFYVLCEYWVFRSKGEGTPEEPKSLHS